MSQSLRAWRQPLSYVVVAALIFGAYARFRGLGSAPFAVDEYYLARSVGNILRAGLPAFPCGGLYPRGIVLQYLAAALQLTGLSGELAPRLISALSSLAALPAAYLLARRLNGRVVALLVVSILALSVWEIEMARFGRMYAPFQAVFLWYLVFFLRYTVDRDLKALWPMLILSMAGPLVWEGGVFLPLANLLSVVLPRWPDRLRREDWLALIGFTALLAIAVWFVTRDFRGYNAANWPAGYVRSLSTPAPDPISTLRLRLPEWRHHPGLIAAALLPLLATLTALRWIWSRRSNAFAALGLLAVLGLAAGHQFLAVGAIALLLLLTRLISWQELFSRAAAPFHVAILLFLTFWLVFGVSRAELGAADSGSVPRGIAMLAYQFLRFPDFVGVVARPWARAIPHLAAGLLVLTGIALYRAARFEVPSYERVMLIAFLVLLLAASASHPPRQETRYVFFLYPIILMLALSTIARACAAIVAGKDSALAAAFTGVLALGGFALSEDFQPHHEAYIDSPSETFRRNLNQDMQSHLVIRDDYRSIAHWLQQRQGDGHIAINGVHGLDSYFPGFDFFFVDQRDSNFPDWSCRLGTVERWGNYPLLNSVDDLRAAVSRQSGAYLVVFAYDIDDIMVSLAALHPRIAMTQDNIVVLELQG
jgi:uncharacterized membrane protein SirB2